MTHEDQLGSDMGGLWPNVILRCLLSALFRPFHCTLAAHNSQTKLLCWKQDTTANSMDFVSPEQFWYCLRRSTVQHLCPKFYARLPNIYLKRAQHSSIQTCFPLHVISYQAGIQHSQSCQTQARHWELPSCLSNLQCLSLLSSRNICLVSHSLVARATLYFSI